VPEIFERPPALGNDVTGISTMRRSSSPAHLHLDGPTPRPIPHPIASSALLRTSRNGPRSRSETPAEADEGGGHALPTLWVRSERPPSGPAQAAQDEVGIPSIAKKAELTESSLPSPSQNRTHSISEAGSATRSSTLGRTREPVRPALGAGLAAAAAVASTLPLSTTRTSRKPALRSAVTTSPIELSSSLAGITAAVDAATASWRPETRSVAPRPISS
jgi:hypothetical protein